MSDPRSNWKDIENKVTEYSFDDISKYSKRSKAVSKVKPNVQKTNHNEDINRTEDIISQIASEKCLVCAKSLCETDDLRFEGNAVFCSEMCWARFVKSYANESIINLQELPSISAKILLLNATIHGKNKHRIKNLIHLYETQLNENIFHLIIKSSKITFRFKRGLSNEKHRNEITMKTEDEIFMSKLHNIFTKYQSCNLRQINGFIRELMEFKHAMSLKFHLELQMIYEYINLLDFQKLRPYSLNMSLIATLHELNSVSDMAYLTKNNNFKLNVHEVFWAHFYSILRTGSVSNIDNLLKINVDGVKCNIKSERMINFIEHLKPFDLVSETNLTVTQMVCLTKIKNTEELYEIATKYNLMNAFILFCKENHDKDNHLKRLQLLNVIAHI